LTFVDEAAIFIGNARKTKLVTPRRIAEDLLFQKQNFGNPKSRSSRLVLHIGFISTNPERNYKLDHT